MNDYWSRQAPAGRRDRRAEPLFKRPDVIQIEAIDVDKRFIRRHAMSCRQPAHAACVIIRGNIPMRPVVSTDISPRIIQPIAAVLAVVLRGPDILLVQRANRPDAGLWGFPGGKVEAGETRFQAARRELLEETQVSAEPFRLLAELDAFDHDDSGGLMQHFVMAAVACRWISGEPIASDDALQARWVPRLELDGAGLAFSKDVVNVARMAVKAI